MDVNSDKLNAFMGKMVSDLGAAMNASLMLLGDKLGLYKALAAKGPMNSSELARRTGTAERYVREWLAAQAASGYVEYDAARPANSRCSPSRRWRLADEDSPVFLGAVGNVDRGGVSRRAEDYGRIHDRQRRRLEPAQRVPVLRHGALLPHRLHASSGAGMAARA